MLYVLSQKNISSFEPFYRYTDYITTWAQPFIRTRANQQQCWDTKPPVPTSARIAGLPDAIAREATSLVKPSVMIPGHYQGEAVQWHFDGIDGHDRW